MSQQELVLPVSMDFLGEAASTLTEYTLSHLEHWVHISYCLTAHTLS